MIEEINNHLKQDTTCIYEMSVAKIIERYSNGLPSKIEVNYYIQTIEDDNNNNLSIFPLKISDNNFFNKTNYILGLFNQIHFIKNINLNFTNIRNIYVSYWKDYLLDKVDKNDIEKKHLELLEIIKNTIKFVNNVTYENKPVFNNLIVG